MASFMGHCEEENSRLHAPFSTSPAPTLRRPGSQPGRDTQIGRIFGMNKAVVGAVALVVVAGGGIGFAAWSGGKVSSELQSQTAALLAPFPGLKLVENSVS